MINSLSNKPTVMRSFEVRVRVPGVAPYKYKAIATDGFGLWCATFTRLTAGLAEDSVQPTIAVKRIRTN